MTSLPSAAAVGSARLRLTPPRSRGPVRGWSTNLTSGGEVRYCRGPALSYLIAVPDGLRRALRAPSGLVGDEGRTTTIAVTVGCNMIGCNQYQTLEVVRLR